LDLTLHLGDWQSKSPRHAQHKGLFADGAGAAITRIIPATLRAGRRTQIAVHSGEMAEQRAFRSADPFGNPMITNVVVVLQLHHKDASRSFADLVETDHPADHDRHWPP
jgi:DNA-binding phage protein